MGLIANLLAMPIISLVTAPAAAAALVLVPLGLDGIALRVFGASLGLVLDIAHFFSAWDVDQALSVPQMPALSFGLFVGSLVIFCLLRTPMAAWLAPAGITLAAGLFWFQSGSDKIHFAPSGDVFLEFRNGDVERVAWRDGNGLGPLRFSGLAVNRVCIAQTHCELEFARHMIRLSAQLEVPAAHVFATDQAPLIVSWEEIIRSNGVTLVSTNDGFQRKQKPDCGSRAWRICRLDE